MSDHADRLPAAHSNTNDQATWPSSAGHGKPSLFATSSSKEEPHDDALGVQLLSTLGPAVKGQTGKRPPAIKAQTSHAQRPGMLWLGLLAIGIACVAGGLIWQQQRTAPPSALSHASSPSQPHLSPATTPTQTRGSAPTTAPLALLAQAAPAESAAPAADQASDLPPGLTALGQANMGRASTEPAPHSQPPAKAAKKETGNRLEQAMAHSDNTKARTKDNKVADKATLPSTTHEDHDVALVEAVMRQTRATQATPAEHHVRSLATCKQLEGRDAEACKAQYCAQHPKAKVAKACRHG